MWSTERLPEQLEPTEWARKLEAGRCEADDDILDLTLTNPSRLFPEHRRRMQRAWREAASAAGSRPYRPEPFGLFEAREAVASYYAERGAGVDAARVALTASTSEAYTWLAKVIVDPGATVLVPTPSYPLFEHLMRLECARVQTYPFRFDGSWHVDAGELDRRVQEADDPRAIFCVSPNNPTGHVLSEKEFDQLLRTCARHDLLLVVDEVFRDFGLDAAPPVSSVNRVSDCDDAPALVVLSGLSKTAGLPGAKLGWMVFAGRDEDRGELMRRLEFVADSFLSVSTSSQLLAPRVLGNLDEFHRTVQERTRSNLETLREAAAVLPTCDVYPAEAGWYGILRAPEFVDSASFAVDVLENRKVLVQPGFLFDLRRGAHFVLSLLPKCEDFRSGIGSVVDELSDRIGS